MKPVKVFPFHVQHNSSRSRPPRQNAVGIIQEDYVEVIKDKSNLSHLNRWSLGRSFMVQKEAITSLIELGKSEKGKRTKVNRN